MSPQQIEQVEQIEQIEQQTIEIKPYTPPEISTVQIQDVPVIEMTEIKIKSITPSKQLKKPIITPVEHYKMSVGMITII